MYFEVWWLRLVSLGIFYTLPCHTVLTKIFAYIRTHTHFQQLITGRQSISNADTECDTECSKNVQIDYTASAPCAHAHTYTGSYHALRTHTHTHTHTHTRLVFTSLGRNTYICVPAHIRTYTPLITTRQSTLNADKDTFTTKCAVPVPAGQSARAGQP